MKIRAKNGGQTVDITTAGNGHGHAVLHEMYRDRRYCTGMLYQ